MYFYEVIIDIGHKNPQLELDDVLEQEVEQVWKQCLR